LHVCNFALALRLVITRRRLLFSLSHLLASVKV
jgi:hypothetical protein